jgi:hypothetical protein
MTFKSFIAITPNATASLSMAGAAAKREARSERRRELRATKKASSETATAVKAVKPTVTADAIVAVVKEPTKKERTIAIYAEVMNGTGARRDGIARLTAELNMSTAAASTYWQSCKAGVWL